MTGALAGLRRPRRRRPCSPGPMAAMHLGDFGAEVVKVEHPRRPDPARGHGPAKDGDRPLVQDAGPQQAQHHARPVVARRGGGASAGWPPTRGRRRSRTSARARWSAGASAYDAAARATTRASSSPGSPASARSARTPPPRLRHAGRGDERVRRVDRRAGRAADPAAVRPGRRDRRAGHGVRGHDRPPATRPRPGGARWSTSPSSSRSWRCSARRSRAGTSSARSRRARQPVAPTTRRATPTAPPTATGSPSPPARSRIAERVMRLVGRPDLIDEPWFATGAGRGPSTPTSSTRPSAAGSPSAPATRSSPRSSSAEAAVAPIYDRRGHRRRPAVPGARHHPPGRTTTTSASCAMQGPLFRLADGDAPTRFAGRAPGADTTAVLRELGYDDDEIAALVAGGAAGGPGGPAVSPRPPLTWLYVPGDRPDRVAKALASAADVVIVDLEDAVVADAKPDARQATADALHGASRPLQVRVNAPGTPWHDDDVAMVARLPGAVGLRLPKAESVDAVRDVSTSAPDRAAPPARRVRPRARARLRPGHGHLRRGVPRTGRGRPTSRPRRDLGGRPAVGARSHRGGRAPPPVCHHPRWPPTPTSATWTGSPHPVDAAGPWVSSVGPPSTRTSWTSSAPPSRRRRARSNEPVSCSRRPRRAPRRVRGRWPSPTAGSSTPR